jgi:phospholipid transport system substrate-binding protein
MLLCTALLVAAADVATADASDPAAMQVETLNASLLQSMRAGAAQPMAERYRNLEPVIEQVFALPLMTRLAVGPEWASFSPEQQNASIAAFRRYTTANYAYNFRDFGGEKFEVDGNVLNRGNIKVVRTRITSLHETPASVLYRMHEVDGTWKVVDVSFDGVSQLAVRRTDFAAAIAAGGAPQLIAYLNKASDQLMKQ